MPTDNRGRGILHSIWGGVGRGRDHVVSTDEQGFYAYGYVQGRMYDKWVDVSPRNNGYDEDDLIVNPAGIIESILRDEIFAERDLVITSKSTRNTMVIDELVNGTDDFYNGAYLHNATQGFTELITDYTGSTKTVTVNGDEAEINANDKIFITNIQGDNKIDIPSFDLIGNTTNGKRNGWKFGASIHRESYASDILSSLLEQSRCILFTSHNKYKLVAIDDGTEVATWTSPLKQNGKLLASVALTPLDILYNDFRVYYHYDYGAGEYKKSLFVNKAGFSSSLTSGSTYKATCKSLFDDYKILNPFEFYCDWIYDDATAEMFFDKIFAWYSKQRLIVNWAAPVSNHVQYEIGDIIKLNNTNIIPAGINNTSKFMIMENPLRPLPGAPFINFKLIEL